MLKSHEFETLVQKLNLKTRNTGDRHAWFEYEGKVIARTRRSHGRGDMPASDQIRQQLKLNEEELRQILQCRLYRQDYIEILRRKGKLPPAS